MLSQCCGESLDFYCIYKSYAKRNETKAIGFGAECIKCEKDYPVNECQVRETSGG